MIASHVFGGHYDRYDEEEEQPMFGTIARLMQNLRYFGAFYKSFDKNIIKLNLAGKSFQVDHWTNSIELHCIRRLE